MSKRIYIALLFLIMAFGLHAESAYAFIFKEGKTANIDAAMQYQYAQEKTDKAQSLDFEERILRIDVLDKDLKLTLYEGDKSRALGQYPKSVGNPIHMYFLESVIADMQADTGGSNFYIRNRLKAALAETEAKPEPCGEGMQCLSLQPFLDDEAREKMGLFADLELSFRFDENHPLWVVGLRAENPDKPNEYSFELELE